MTQIAEHTREYRGYLITPKLDLEASGGFLIRGEVVNEGFVVVKQGCNVMPGAAWFRRHAAAKVAIDLCEFILDQQGRSSHPNPVERMCEDSRTIGKTFWELYRSIAPMGEYDIKDFPTSNTANKVYYFDNLDSRFAAAEAIDTAFDHRLKDISYTFGTDRNSLTVYNTVPDPLDSLIRTYFVRKS